MNKYGINCFQICNIYEFIYRNHVKISTIGYPEVMGYFCTIKIAKEINFGYTPLI